MVAAALVALAAVVVAAGWGVRPAGAQGAERIRDYRIDLRILADGDLDVREVITYDFGSARRHGIFRDLTVRLRYDSRYDRVYPIDAVTVTASPGASGAYTVEEVGGKKRLRIGDPDRTITGTHTYTIAYRSGSTLNGFDDHDELYWNAIGTEWDVPVDRATVTVGAPAVIGRVACFAGPLRSRLPCRTATSDASTATFTHDGLGPNEAFTVVAAIPTGVVPRPVPRLDERWSAERAFSVTRGTVGAAGALAAAILAGFAALAWNAGRDRRYAGSPVDAVFGAEGDVEEPVPLLERPVTPVEFAPPDGVRPGQVGTLVDEHANPLDVVATIVDLAVRGYLRIDEIPKKGWFKKADWTLVRLDKDTADLLPYERRLHAALFERAVAGEVRMSQLRNTFAQRLQEVQEALYEDALSKRWFPARPDRIRTLWRAIGVGAVLAGAAVVWLVARSTHAGIVPLPLALGGLLLIAGAGRMPRRTGRGTAVLRRVEGFRRFIEDSEQDRARFAERKNLFSEYLPYAVVFGCTEKWARAFAGVDGELPEVSWYSGTDGFTAASFSSSMDGFTVTTAGTIASTPGGSGSSGFGGGGSSGGGGGGGGGGSW